MTSTVLEKLCNTQGLDPQLVLTVNTLREWASPGQADLVVVREGDTRCIVYQTTTDKTIEWKIADDVHETRRKIEALRDQFKQLNRLSAMAQSVSGFKRIHLFSFRNRTLTKVTTRPEVDFWETHDETLTLRQTEKYPGYSVWQSPVLEEEWVASTPTRATIMYTVDGKDRFAVVKLPTVQVTKCEHVGPMVLHTVQKEDIDTSKLPQTVWKQLGQKGGNVIVLVQFRKKEKIDTSIEKDDITGEVNVYRVCRIILLKKRK